MVWVPCEVVEIDDAEDLMNGNMVNDKAKPIYAKRMSKVSHSVRSVSMDETVDEVVTYETSTSETTTRNESGVKGDTSVKGDTDVVTRPLALILT